MTVKATRYSYAIWDVLLTFIILVISISVIYKHILVYTVPTTGLSKLYV